MATRNNGDEPPSGNGPPGRPGSYVKIAASSRRRRRGRKTTNSVRPSTPSGAEALEQSSQGADASGDAGLDEPFEPPVDDLRSKSAVSLAAQRAPGPLGMAEARGSASELRHDEVRGSAGDRGAEARGESESRSGPPSSSVAHVRVVEVNAPQRGSDNSNAATPNGDSVDDPLRAHPALSLEPRLAHVPSPIDEPFAPSHAKPAATPTIIVEGTPSHDPAHAGESAFEHAPGDEGDAHRDHGDGPHHDDGYAPGRGFVVDAQGSARPHQLASAEPYGGDAARDDTPRLGFSSVLNARPSLRPSPPPPPRSALAWWLAVLALCSIIAAAVVVALRERMDEEGDPGRTVGVPAESTPTGAAEAPAPEQRVSATPPVEALPTSDAAAAKVENIADAGVAAPGIARGSAKAAVAVDAAVKPARVWKPRKQVADAGALRAAPAAEPSAPAEVVPRNPYEP